MKLFKNEEEAVSPVIGVILMVAIVVILAAVIAAFVFGMAGSSTTSKNVATTVTMNAAVAPATGYSGFNILWQGGSDIAKVTDVNYNAIISTGPTGTLSCGIPAAGLPPDVGQINTVPQVMAAGDRLIITATFSDGSQQVIFDRTV